MSSPLLKLGFPFQHYLQLNSRYFCSNANPKLIAIDNPRKFMHYVIKQCRLGFHNLQFPIYLFHQMMSLVRRPSIIDFSRLFCAMLKLKRLQPHSTVISLSRQLELSGTQPDLYSIGILANCYCHVGRVDFGFSLLAKSLKLGFPFESDLVLFTTLINGLVQNDRLLDASKLLDVAVLKLGIQLDLVTYGTMVKALCRIGDNAGALDLLRRMNSSPSGCKPDLIIYATLIDSLCKDKLISEAVNLFSVMKTEGIKPNVFTYTSLIRGMFNLGRKGEAKDMVVEMMESNMHSKDGMIDDAQAILKIMIEQGVVRDVVVYNALLNGYCLCGQMDKARELVDLMVKTKCHPDGVTYNTLIKGYVKLNRIDKALDVLQEMLEHGIAHDIVGCNTLIDGLCKSNRILRACQLFYGMQIDGIKPDVYTYASLLDGLCKNAQLNEAVALLREMESNGVAPNIVIYNILIDNLCEAGQFKDAENLISDLVSKGLVPNHRTYTSMIKGFCKKGLMNYAVKLLHKMNQVGCTPNKRTYNTLIRGFIVNNDMPNALRYRDIMVSMGF